MALTPRQEMFIREYLIDLNGTQAAIRAGYSPKTANEQASRLLANANIRSLVQDQMDKRANDLGIDANYVLRTIKNTIERCSQVEKVILADGTATGEYKFDASAVLKGAELLGKNLKMFTDKIDVNAHVTTHEATLDDLA